MKKNALLFGLTLTFSTPVIAAETLESCISEHNSCVSECLGLEGDATQATCVAKCAGLEAQCAGQIGISKSEPYIRKKTQQLEDLLNDFFGDILPGMPEKEPEKKPDISSTDT